MNERDIFIAALNQRDMAFGSYEVGVIQRTPVPKQIDPALGALALEAVNRGLLGRIARRQVRVVFDGQAAAEEGAGKVNSDPWCVVL